MGLADLIPGISGGTIAIITNIYASLIHALTELTRVPRALGGYLRGTTPFTTIYSHIHISFLLPLGSGIIFALLAGSHLLVYALQLFPQYIYSLLVGLLFAGGILLLTQAKQALVYALPGALLGYGITFLPVTTLPNHLGVYFALAIVAVSAMLLPGVSGSYIFFLTGSYEYLLSAIQQPLQHISLLATLVAGGITGVFLVSRGIDSLLRTRRAQTVAFLAGLLLGTLRTPYTFIAQPAEFGVYIAFFLGISIILLLEGTRYLHQKTHLAPKK